MSFIKEFWLPDAEILNLKEFKTLDVLSKLEVNIITRLTFHYGQASSLVCMLNNNNNLKYMIKIY